MLPVAEIPVPAIPVVAEPIVNLPEAQTPVAATPIADIPKPPTPLIARPLRKFRVLGDAAQGTGRGTSCVDNTCCPAPAAAATPIAKAMRRSKRSAEDGFGQAPGMPLENGSSSAAEKARRVPRKAAGSDSESDLISELSNQSADADEELLTIGVEREHTLPRTLEDLDSQRIASLAQHLRPKPLEPPLPSACKDQDLLHVEGLRLPAVHCAFKGCAWISEQRPCLRVHTNAKSVRCYTKAGVWTGLPCREAGNRLYFYQESFCLGRPP